MNNVVDPTAPGESNFHVEGGFPSLFLTQADVTAGTPIRITDGAGGPGRLSIDIAVDAAGNLVGGGTPTDFQLIGEVDTDGNSNPNYTGVLLSGQVAKFGYYDGTGAEPDLDEYDFSFTVTGGSLAPDYFAGKDIGAVVVSPNSTFAGTFDTNFAGESEGSVGPVEPPTGGPPVGVIDIEKYVKPVEQPVGGEGLTPGFWKQTQHFYAWTGYTQDQKYDAVFGLTPAQEDPNLTLLGALQRGGGGKNALGRHAVAALLNAANPNIDYAYTTAQIIAMVQNAYASGDFETTKNLFAVENEKGADLSDGTMVMTPPPGFGFDADDPTGPVVPVGSQVQFTFVVTNPGTVPLSNVVVTDNNETPGTTTDDFNPTPVLEGGFNVGDDNADGKLDPGEVWLYTWTKTVTAGQHTNRGTVVGTPDVPNGGTVTDYDDANWFGGTTAPVGKIDIEKYVKPADTTQPPSAGGEGLTPGYWKQSQHFDQWVGYTQGQNYNQVFGVNDPDTPTLLGALSRGGGGYKALGRHAVAALLNAANPNISYAYTTAQIIAMVQNAFATGDYETAKNKLAAENEKGADLTPTGGSTPTPSSGFGFDADDPTGPTVAAGSTVVFTFVVTNPGQAPLANVIVTDNNETPGDAGDDFKPTAVLFDGTAYNIGDDNKNSLLDPGEVWLYTHSKVTTAPGQHTNVGTATGTSNVGGNSVTDSDAANWYVPPPPSASIGDFVFQDCNGNGVQDAGESGVGGVLVKLLDGNGNPVLNASSQPITTTTNANGYYLFSGLAAGTYSVQFVAPAGYAFTAADKGADDAKDSDANPSTGRTANFTLAAGQTDLTRDAGLYQPASISGFVYNDLDDDGIKESGEPGIGGVTLKLLNGSGAVVATTTTNSSGAYTFTNLAPGTYTVAEAQPAGYADGDDTVGTVNGVSVGVAPATDNDTLTTITLKCDDDGINYNFGELGIFHGLTATIGFWHNKNGQALINSFGKTANGLTLGGWLATTMPNLFGKYAPALTTSSTKGANLTSATNAQVAAYFMQLFGVTGQKAYAQVLATAFAVFTTTNAYNTGATSRSLAAKYGFSLSNTGTGAATINIGSNGPAFGLPNNSTVSILTLLLQAHKYTVSGTLNGGNAANITLTNNMFDLINNKGDIGAGMALVSAGATSVGAVGTLGQLYAGTYLVSVDSVVSAAQDGRIQDAIGRLNTALGAYGILLAVIPQGVTASADIHVALADTTAIGGAADGVLGLTELGGLVTIVKGWDYYLGADAVGIGGSQYDFETVVMHELGHALGLGHSADADSVMFESLAAGAARRSFSATDLALLGHVDEADDAEAGLEALRAATPRSQPAPARPAHAAKARRNGGSSATPAALASPVGSPFSDSRVRVRRIADDVLAGAV